MVVVAPDVVWHTTTGSEAVTIGPEPAPAVVGVEDVDDDVVVGADVLDVVDCFGWVVPDVESGPDDPQAARSSAPATTTPARPRPRYDTHTPLALRPPRIPRCAG